MCKCLAKIAPVVVGGPFNSLRPSPFNVATETTTTNVQGRTGAELEPCMCQIRVQSGSPAGLSAATATKFAGSCTVLILIAVGSCAIPSAIAFLIPHIITFCADVISVPATLDTPACVLTSAIASPKTHQSS